MSTIVLQKYENPGTSYLSSITQFEYSRKNANVTIKCKCQIPSARKRKEFIKSNFKSTLYVAALKEKILAKIIETRVKKKLLCFWYIGIISKYSWSGCLAYTVEIASFDPPKKAKEIIILFRKISFCFEMLWIYQKISSKKICTSR